MKKRMIIIWLMMACVLVICVFEVMFIDNVSRSSNDLIVQMQSLKNTNQSELVSSKAQKLEALWQQNIPVMSAFVQHNSIDEIEQSVAVIKMAIDTGDDETFYAESARALAQIQSLRDTEFPFVENIL